MDRNHLYASSGVDFAESLSARRAWIEIWSAVLTELLILSLSARRAWIEIRVPLSTVIVILSLSARRAWIEIVWLELFLYYQDVALRKESVDRNIDRLYINFPVLVALRKESVDRNL